MNVSQDQLYNLIVSVARERESQANSGGSLGQESALTPWVAHKLHTFVHKNLVRSNNHYQLRPNESQRGQVRTKSSVKGRGSNATSNKGRGSNAPTPNFDWNEDVDRDERDGDNELPTNGGLVGNSKRVRSPSKSTDERVPVKRGARGGQGSQDRAGSSRQGTGDNPQDCEDKSQVWKCPLEECRGHLN